MKLQPLFDIHADLKTPLEMGQGPWGTRIVFDITGGSFGGERIRGSVRPGGADWFLIDAEGTGHVDVRVILETDDGASVYLAYQGVVVLNDKVNRVLAEGGAIEFGDTYFVTQPRFETGDERYRWLNRVVAAAQGRVMENAVEYRVHAIVLD